MANEPDTSVDEQGISDTEFQAAVDWVNARYSDALKRLAQ
jgi:hypothetical protein